MTGYLIGVDVGSSDCKALVMDTGGAVIASSAVPYPTRYPRPGWAEQDAHDWYRAACRAIREATRDLDAGDVIALAVDGPAHNVALLDEAGDVIYPVIHWSDLRSVAQSAALEAQLGDRIFAATYSRVNPSWTLTQLIWLRENEPQIWRKLCRFLVTKDYVRYRLTGVYQTDSYDAIGTQLYDVAGETWSPELGDLAALADVHLPPVAASFSLAGGLTADAARATGLPQGTPVAVGSGDSVVEAFGIGAVKPGQCLVKLGTAANVNLVTARPLPSPKTITYRHLIGDCWFTISATNAGAASVRWFRETFLVEQAAEAKVVGRSIHTVMDELAGQAMPGAEGLMFHPYLMGERSPYWDPNLRGDFVGVSARHCLAHFARAVLEGVAYSIRDCLEAVAALGQPIETLFLIGGAARSPLWQQILADVLGRPLVKPSVEDAAFGAAMVAGVAAGVFTDGAHAVECCVRTAHTIQPDAARTSLYERYFAIYRAVTRDLAAHNHALVELASERQPNDH